MFTNEPQTDVIDVRSDEKFDEVKIAAFLKGKLPGSENPLAVRQFGGGAANLTYLLDYGTHEYVLRRPPLGPVAKSAHDMKREYTVLSKLYQAFPYAPRAFLFSDDHSLIGSDFFVMERRHGIVVRRKYQDKFKGDDDAGRKMSFALVDALAQFHAVDYDAIGLSELGKPDGFVERQIEGWNRRWHKAKEQDSADFDFVYEWLKNNVPATSRSTLVHNDFKLDNCMLAADDPSKLVAVFDWDMCTLGDPLCDLGALLTYWYEPTDPPYIKAMTPMPGDYHGFATRRELVDRYAQTSGLPMDDIEFYYALGLYRLVVIIQQIYIRYVRGQTKDKRFAGMGQVVPMIIEAAKNVATGELKI
ncbi:MAG: phosphotransferase family protein [Anaerolineae bacterium]